MYYHVRRKIALLENLMSRDLFYTTKLYLFFKKSCSKFCSILNEKTFYLWWRKAQFFFSECTMNTFHYCQYNFRVCMKFLFRWKWLTNFLSESREYSSLIDISAKSLNCQFYQGCSINLYFYSGKTPYFANTISVFLWKFSTL